MRRQLIALLVLLGLLSTIAPPRRAPVYAAPVQHGMGLILPATLPAFHAAGQYSGVPSDLPPSVDLSYWDPPVGDQGSVGSCVAWATGYNLRGWYANRDSGYPVDGFAPMSVYSRIVSLYDQGQDAGATLEQGLDVQRAYGIDTEHDYAPQGYFDYTDLPTPAQAANALRYRLPGYTTLFPFGAAPSAGVLLAQRALAAGSPVVLGIEVTPNFEQATAANPLIGVATGPILGGHAILADGYDARGIWIENQWGTSWGLHGRAEISYDYLNTALIGVVRADIPAPVPSPTSSPTASPVPPTASPTATPTVPAPIPTGTSVVSPTATLTPATGLVPWPHANITGLPRLLPAGTYKVTLIVTDSFGRTRAMAAVSATKH